METMIKEFAQKIKEQDNLVKGLYEIVKQNESKMDDPTFEDVIDVLVTTAERERTKLRNMRKSLEYMVYAAGMDLTPDQRQTPELYV
jgi:hypothetical protein